jgi:hypothetical protein
MEQQGRTLTAFGGTDDITASLMVNGSNRVEFSGQIAGDCFERSTGPVLTRLETGAGSEVDMGKLIKLRLVPLLATLTERRRRKSGGRAFIPHASRPAQIVRPDRH